MNRTVVEELAYNAVMRAKSSLKDVQEITDRTEGKAPQTIDLTSAGEPIQALVVFMEDND
jgi:ferritin-like protein